MTEKEAKTKWCPMVRVGEDDAAGNRTAACGVVNAGLGAGTPWQNCIASDCMMWRATDNEIKPQSPADRMDAKSEPAGYCGLAGKP